MEKLTLTNNQRTNYDLPKLLYTIKEAAYILSVSEKSVRRFLERGLLRTSLALRTKLITRESIEAFVKMTT
jgi:predicted site-specific integrase-resolvase